MKRLIALLLVVFAIAAILPMSVFAAAGGSEVEQEAVGGEVNANANANNYFYIAMWDGSTYQTSNNWYKSGSYAYGRRSGSASASNYDLKVLQSYTPALSGVSVSWTSYSSGSGYWRAYKNISSGTLSAANALPTSDPMSYNNSWKLVGFSNVSTSSSYTIDTSFSSYNTAVSSWSDLRSKISGGASSNGSSYYVLFYSNASGSGGGTTTQPTTYVYPAYLNGSSYTRNADYYYYSSQSNYHVKVGGTAGITLYDLKLKGTYTAGSGTTVSNNFTTSTNATSKWTVTKSSGTLNATDAIPTSETSIIPAYNNGWKLVGYSYTANEPGSTLPTMTAVSSYSDLRTKLSGQSASATQAKHLILYFAKPIAARMCHYVDSKYVGYETVNMFLNTPVQITASTAGKDYFDTENYDYNFVFWADMSEAAYGNVTFGSVTANPTTVTGTATNSSGEIRFKCAWSSSAKTRPTHDLVVKTSINGDIVSTSEPITIKETFTQSIQADTSMFNNNAYTYTFVCWSLTSGSVSNANSQTTTFTMGTADAVATAVFTATALNNPGGGGSGTGTGTNPEDGEFSIKFYVLYVDSSYNLGYNYESGWDVYYNCQDVHCTHVNATSHSMAKSVIRAQIANATVTEGWEILGWTKTVSADPTINSAEGNDNVTITVGNSIYLVAKKDAQATATKTFKVQYKVNGTTMFDTDVTLTKEIWSDVTIDANDYMAQAGVTGYALTGETTYTHAWATFPASVDFAIEVSVAPFTVSGCTITSTYTTYTQLSALGYAIGHKTEYVASEFKDFRKKLTVTVPGLAVPTEVTVYTAPRGGEARLDYVTLTPTAAAATITVEYNEATRRVEVTDTEHLIKSMWFAQGHHTKYADMKTAPGFKNITSRWYYVPIVSAESLEYTYYMKMNDGTYAFKYMTLAPTQCPDVVIVVSDLTVFVTDETAEYVKTMYVAKGHYDDLAAMKADRATNGYKSISQSKCHTFSGVSGATEVSVYYKDLNNVIHWQYKTITPEFTVSVTMDSANKVTVEASTGVFEDIKSVYFASGHCTTYAQMKVADFHKAANSTHSLTLDFATYGNEFTVRVVTVDGNTLYYSIFSNGTITVH